MNDEGALARRPRPDQVSRPTEITTVPGRGTLNAAELEQKLELRARLQAIIDELDVLDADVDVPRTITEGLLEELDAALSQESA